VSSLKARLAAIGLGLSGVFVTASPVAAECPGADPWPSFRLAAASARQIMIVEVTETLDLDSADNAIQFRVRVVEALRGSSTPPPFETMSLTSGWPATVCEPTLRVHQGDVIALALAARFPGVANPVNSVAYVRGTPSRHPDMSRVERITVAEVRRLAALPQTDTEAPLQDRRTSASSWLMGVTWLVAFVTSLVVFDRSRRSAYASSRRGGASAGTRSSNGSVPGDEQT
jgi:hypothetical protein